MELLSTFNNYNIGKENIFLAMDYINKRGKIKSIEPYESLSYNLTFNQEIFTNTTNDKIFFIPCLINFYNAEAGTIIIRFRIRIGGANYMVYYAQATASNAAFLLNLNTPINFFDMNLVPANASTSFYFQGFRVVIE